MEHNHTIHPGVTSKMTFSERNRIRCEAPNGFNKALSSWTLSDWLTATAGELGEAANIIKKLNRVRDGIPGNSETPDELRKALPEEIADVAIYLDLLAQAAGFDLEEIRNAKFEKTSAKIGYVEHTIPPGVTDAPQITDTHLGEQILTQEAIDHILSKRYEDQMLGLRMRGWTCADNGESYDWYSDKHDWVGPIEGIEFGKALDFERLEAATFLLERVRELEANEVELYKNFDTLTAELIVKRDRIAALEAQLQWLRAPDKYVEYVLRPFVIEHEGKFWLVFRDGSGFLHYWNNDFEAPAQCVDTDFTHSIGLPPLPTTDRRDEAI